MIEVSIGPELREKCPGMALGVMLCNIQNTEGHDEVWDELLKEAERIRQHVEMKAVKDQHNIRATREVYKACGKEPNRYRPAAEALYRRILKNQEIYRINALVDLVNLFSLRTGYSIGGFDADQISWPVVAGIGKANEGYKGIGRGSLNIENMPVLRDRKGPIGTPTSDEERTAVTPETSRFFMNINGYTGPGPLEKEVTSMIPWLEKYVAARHIQYKIIR